MKVKDKLLKLMALLAVAAVALTVTLSAQTDELSKEDQELVEKLKTKPLNGFFGITFTNVVPQGELYDYVKTSGQGFSVYGGYEMDPVPVSFGMELDFLFYGGETRYFSGGPGNWNTYRDTVETSSSMIPLNVFVRLQPNIMNFVYPYIEGLAGINFLSVSADLTTNHGASDSKDRFDVAFNYGFGAGVMIKLVDFVQLPNSHSQLLFDVKMRYLKGTESEYSTVKILDDSSPEFHDFTTKTDLITFSAGIAFRF